MRRVLRLAGLLLLVIFLAGCGRSYTRQQQVEERLRVLIPLLVSDPQAARAETTGAARQSLDSLVSQPGAGAIQRQVLGEVAVTVDPVGRRANLATAAASYRLQSRAPALGTAVEQVTARYGLVLVDGRWLISQISQTLAPQREG